MRIWPISSYQAQWSFIPTGIISPDCSMARSVSSARKPREPAGPPASSWPRWDYHAACRRDRAQAADEKLARDDDNGDPRRHQSDLHQRDQDGRYEDLVGGEIEKDAEIRDDAVLARDAPVQCVAHRGEEEQRGRRQICWGGIHQNQHDHLNRENEPA